jgi:hypothetical protein
MILRAEPVPRPVTKHHDPNTMHREKLMTLPLSGRVTVMIAHFSSRFGKRGSITGRPTEFVKNGLTKTQDTSVNVTLTLPSSVLHRDQPTHQHVETGVRDTLLIPDLVQIPRYFRDDAGLIFTERLLALSLVGSLSGFVEAPLPLLIAVERWSTDHTVDEVVTSAHDTASGSRGPKRH